MRWVWLFVWVVAAFAPNPEGTARAGEPGALVDAAWLSARLDDPEMVVIDLRPDAAFRAGHVRGAVNLPLRGGAWLETRYGVPGMMVAPEALARALGRRGVGSGQAVVVVSAGGEVAALAEGARAFWQMRVLGHERLFLLDGGMAAWRAAGLARQAGPAAPRRAARYVARVDRSVLAGVMHVEDAMDDNTPPIDARDRDAFDGHVVSPLVDEGGTILDAVNLPAADLLAGASGQFLPVGKIMDRAARARVPERRQVVFSDTGLRAALVWFALHEIAGIGTARLYDGSLAQWAAEDYDMYDSTDGMGGVIGG